MAVAHVLTEATGFSDRLEAETVRGARVEAQEVTRIVGKAQLLGHISLNIQPGELVAIVGVSGAGKSTLLRTLAGLDRASSGTVLHDGRAVGDAGVVENIGYVPQDDIIHTDLPLRQALLFAGRLRLPRDVPRAEVSRVVDATLARLDLQAHAKTVVRDLSGGQRKRASIAVELLTRPRLFVLDEPTSGLDPATAAEVMAVLRAMAASGTTVILTTHRPEDVSECDRVVFLANGGRLAFDGVPSSILSYFEVERFAEIYSRVWREETPDWWAAEFERSRGPRLLPPPAPPPEPQRRSRRGDVRGLLLQWVTLVGREAALLLRNRLTLAIMVGSPVLVTMMMAILFRAGTFEGGASDQRANLVFWLAFDGFFFGLTYGLLQVVVEFPIFQRERLAGLGVGTYVASKLAVMLPVLAAIDVMILAALWGTDRLPDVGLGTYSLLAGLFLLDATAGLGFGLLASALVRNPAQAALALPMICFPQVLFGGAIVPSASMSSVGSAMSGGMATRWAFEGMRRALDVPSPAPGGGSGEPTGQAIATLAVMALGLALLTVVALHRRTARS
jgi:ABC-type multidrug transport system ATPase subunit